MGCVNSIPTSLSSCPTSSGTNTATPVQSNKEEVTDNSWDIVETFNVKYTEPNNEEFINEYKMYEVLGRGSFGFVRRCERIDPDAGPPYKTYAMKILSKSKLRKIKDTILDDNMVPMRVDGLQRLEAEISVMRHLFHRNVCIVFEVIVHKIVLINTVQYQCCALAVVIEIIIMVFTNISPILSC